MHKKMLLLCIPLLFILSNSAEAASSSSFKNLLTNSQLVVSGEVTATRVELEVYWVTFSIDESLYGTAAGTIDIAARTPNGFLLADEAYLLVSKKYVLFLNNSSGFWTVTHGNRGVFSGVYKNDLQNIVSSYNANNGLFGKSSISQLKNVFSSIDSVQVKIRLLDDIGPNLTVSDIPFLEELYNSENIYMNIFSLKHFGRLKVEQKRNDIENLLVNTDVERLKLHAILSLERMRNSESFPVLKDFLSHEDQGVRNAAIHAVSRTGNPLGVQALQDAYANETVKINRIAIIELLEMMPQKNQVLEALRSFKTLENDPMVNSFLNAWIDKAERKKNEQ